MTERKIWKELSDEEQKAEVDRLFARIRLEPGDIRQALKALEYRDWFRPVVAPDKLAPNAEVAKFDRYADYEQMDVDGIIGQALGPYSEDATGAPE